MSTLIKNEKDLPAEFCIKKYDATASFDICNWVIALEFRALTTGREYHPESEHLPLLQQLCMSLLTKPTLLVYDAIERFPGLGVRSKISNIRDMNVADFYWNGRDFDDGVISKKYTDAVDQFVRHESDESVHFYPVRSRCQMQDSGSIMATSLVQAREASGISSNGEVFVEVDLNATDEKIAADFKSWLLDARKLSGVSAPQRKFSDKEFRAWSKNAVLPYLDLTRWAAAHDCEITQQLLGRVLFPDEYDVNLTERIRKTVAPMANDLVNKSFVAALHAQAVADVQALNPEKDIPALIRSNFVPYKKIQD